MSPIAKAFPRTTVLFAGAMLLSLAGCMNDGGTVTDFDLAHPVKVESRLVTMPFAVSADATSLARSDMARFDRFVTNFIRLGGASLEIAAPKGAGDATALAQVSVVRERALSLGVRSNEIRVRFADVGGDGPVVVSYERFSVSTSDCEDFSSPAQANYRNVAHADFGCAVRHNIATMVSNPADLAKAQERTPADEQRRSVVIQGYRGGVNTESAQGPLAQSAGTTDF